MRTYYGSDKKRREDAKRKHQEEKRLKRLNRNASARDKSQTPASETPQEQAPAVPGEGNNNTN